MKKDLRDRELAVIDWLWRLGDDRRLAALTLAQERADTKHHHARERVIIRWGIRTGNWLV